MKTAIGVVAAAVVAGALSTPACAVELNGTVPPGRTIVLSLRQLPGATTWWFLFNAPASSVRYTVQYCIGPRRNPCGPGSNVVSVPEGTTAWGGPVSQATFLTKVLAVHNPGRATVPYAIIYW